VSRRWKPIVACLSLILLANALGCNRGADGNKAQPAAINGSGSETPSEAGLQPPPPPKPTLDSQPPLVAIETSLGKITVELDRAKADLTVDNFLRYVGESFYDQTIVHQVYKGQAVLAGSYGKDMRSIAKSRHISVRNQADNGLKNVCGTIAMMRPANDVHGATSQFFINVADNPSLDYKDRSTTDGYGYCVFGKVVEGMDVVKAINGLDVRDTPEIEQTPKQQVVITSIRRIR
jgi:peptidyl-prolyl cis-trans isomerase B (cyclophilin B)